jgi:hypothetical protein
MEARKKHVVNSVAETGRVHAPGAAAIPSGRSGSQENASTADPFEIRAEQDEAPGVMPGASRLTAAGLRPYFTTISLSVFSYPGASRR